MAGQTRHARILLCAALVLGLSACAASYRNHGYIPPQELLDEIVVGVDTRDSRTHTIHHPSPITQHPVFTSSLC